MGEICVTPLTSKPRAAALSVLITLLLLLLGAAVAEESRTSSVSLHVDQLSNAFKLLQLQLKQTTETAEHVQSLLANLQGGAASAHDQPGAAVVLQEQQQKREQEREQEYEQTPPPVHVDARHGTFAPNRLLVDKGLLPSSTEKIGLQMLLLYSSTVPSAEHWPSEQQAGQTIF